MTFLIHVPAAPLNGAVECFYCPTGRMPYGSEYVMPSPLVDLKINFGESVGSQQAETDAWEAHGGPGWCMGLIDRYHSVRWPGQTDFIGVTLRPGGVFALFGIEAQEIGNRIVALDAMIGRFAAELRDRLAEVDDVQLRFARLEAMLSARMREVRDGGRVAAALARIERSNGRVPIAKLADAAEVSHKHLVTLFNRFVGVPPKRLARLYRLQHLMTSIETREPGSWTAVAHDADYCDQAHFNRDFKRLTGQTPAAYLALRQRARTAHPNHATHRRLLPRG